MRRGFFVIVLCSILNGCAKLDERMDFETQRAPTKPTYQHFNEQQKIDNPRPEKPIENYPK